MNKMPKHLRLLRRIGLQGIDDFFGERKKAKRRYLVNEVVYRMAQDARAAMDKSQRGSGILSDNERLLLSVFYPEGPRYVKPYASRDKNPPLAP